jgi:aspartate aminotransferase
MDILSQRLKQMTYSKTLEMAELARQLKLKGVKVINLSVGEPDFTPFNSILDYAKKSIDEGHHYYTPVAGYL